MLKPSDVYKWDSKRAKTRGVIERLAQSGELVTCSAEEYHGFMRSALQEAAGRFIDQGQDLRASMCLSEVQRLDGQFPETVAE